MLSLRDATSGGMEGEGIEGQGEEAKERVTIQIIDKGCGIKNGKEKSRWILRKIHA